MKNRGRKAFEIPKGVRVDWTQTNKKIAHQLGVSLMTAYNLRKRMGIAPNPRGRASQTNIVSKALAVLDRAYKRARQEVLQAA